MISDVHTRKNVWTKLKWKLNINIGINKMTSEYIYFECKYTQVFYYVQKSIK